MVPDSDIPNNQIKTAKYTNLTFIPMNLMVQFSKLANAYFLIIGTMQMVHSISITDGKPVIFGPLLIVVSISMIKDFFEDYKCHMSDAQENNRLVLKRQGDQYIDCKWNDLLCGDVIRLVNETYLPADIVVLGTSDVRGRIYVETKSLDGETNLKGKVVPKDLKNPKYESIRINYEGPNPYLSRFNGSITVGNLEPIPIGSDNFLLRGCKLMNTDFVEGVVVYTGHDTKIMLNSEKGRPKKSKLESMMNYLIIQIFLLQMIMCFLAGWYNNFWQKENTADLYYMEFPLIQMNPIKNILIKWGSWILIFTNFVPISMLVSLEMVKFVQGMFMVKDPPTYTQQSDIMMTVQSSNLNEELGQVEYIFSDKTGTLTQNIMDFKCLSVGGNSYEQRTLNDQEVKRLPTLSNVDFRDKGFFQALKQPDEMTRNFMVCLSVCHTIAVQVVDREIKYNASSPDELALVNFASLCGYQFQGVDDQDNSLVHIYNDPFDRKSVTQKMRFKILQVLEFSSARKRMSVIVQAENGQIILYTKGADSVIQKRLSSQSIQQTPRGQQTPKTQQYVENTYNHLNEYARQGLRTLVLTQRIIPQSTYNAWLVEYRQAQNCLKDREEEVERIQEKIEVELQLLGGTAIEDKLQDDIGPTITALKSAGMRVWVLTGDKVETAINIGKACELLDQQMEICVVDGVEKQIIAKALDNCQNQIQTQRSRDVGVVVTGDALILIMQDKQLVAQLMGICDSSKAVMCCRVSPKQKAEVVQMVRVFKPTVTTLAIGDGANDVNMITAAHVGVGIRGVEGQQAARASDYAIGQFKILRRLTLFHGRECYRRNARLVTFNFYKNMLLVLPQFWWAFHNGFSAITLYDPLMYQSYNLFYTALPIVLFAIFDQEFTGDFLENNPDLYILGLTSSLFNTKVFLYWIGSGAIQALIIGLLAYPILDGSTEYSSSIMNHNGLSMDIYTVGTIILGFSVINSNLKVPLEQLQNQQIILISNTYTSAIIISLLASVLSFLLMIILISKYMITADDYNTLQATYENPSVYLLQAIILGATTCIDLALTRWSKFCEYSNQTTQASNKIGQGYQNQQDEQQ